MTLEASDPSQVAQNTTMSPLGPPPSVVLMPKHIHQQFETQRDVQAAKSQSKNNMIDNVLRDRNQKRRQKLRREMGNAMTNLRKRQLRFQKYMENRTTPPKHKAFNKSKANDVVSRPGDPGRNGEMQNAATVKKQKYYQKKIELKRKRRKRRRKEYLKWKKYRKRKKEKRRLERYRYRKHKKSKRKRYDSDSDLESDCSYSSSISLMTTSEEDM